MNPLQDPYEGLKQAITKKGWYREHIFAYITSENIILKEDYDKTNLWHKHNKKGNNSEPVLEI